MITTDTYLRTQQVADALGVSVSSIKRWVDSGALEANRTLGKHRLISLSSALRFARRENFPVSDLMALSAVNETITVDDRLCDRLIEALKEGEERLASSLILSAHRSGSGVVALADNVIRPVMERIGQAWFLGQWDVYEEHQATGTIISTLAAINQSLVQASGPSRPLALGASPSGDHYVMPGLLAEIAVREVGWDVRNLGSDLPLRSLASATVKYRPKLIYISASRIGDKVQFINDYAYFYESANQVGAAVMLGGRAFDPELRSRLIFASFGDRMAHLSEFARRMLPRSDSE